MKPQDNLSRTHVFQIMWVLRHPKVPLPCIEKENGRCDLCLTNCINQSIVSGKFPDSLKLASIPLTYKAKDPLDKTNYRSVSVLPLLSKI